MVKVEHIVNGAKFRLDPKQYKIIKPIGFGAYGMVCSATHLPTGENVAIKKIPKLFEDLVDGKRILREIALLRHLNHENVIPIKDICTIERPYTFNDVYIVTELMATDLHHVIRSHQELSREHLQYFTYQILKGLKYVHSAKVIHRDLKPSNILVNGNCDVKICDFGLARGVKDNASDMTEYVVTRWYRAPELLLMSQSYDEAIDMWSVGCILAELIHRKPFFPGRDYLDQLRLITDVMGKPSKEDRKHITHEQASNYLEKLPNKPPQNLRKLLPNANAEEVDLILKMLQFNPKKRITVFDALKHPYFSGLHNEKEEKVCPKPFHFEYDNKEIQQTQLRKELLRNMLAFHPNHQFTKE